jgi:vacuolar iron transporter family protein
MNSVLHGLPPSHRWECSPLARWSPLLPWFLTLRISAVALSLLLAGAAAVTIGAVLGYPNGRRMFYSALRQLLVIALATAVTFFVGRLFGAAVS